MFYFYSNFYFFSKKQMLTKNELLKKFPNPSLEDLKKDRVPIQQKKNIIKNAILKEEVPLNLYLPLTLPRVKKEPEKRKLYDHNKEIEKKKKLEKMRNELNNFSHRPILHKINKTESEKELSNLLKFLKENKEKNKEIEEKILENMKSKPFNLKQLIKKVRNITKSVDSIFKYKINNKYEFAKNFRKHAISYKKNSTPVDEFYDIQRSRDFIHLQKIFLNNEYYNLMSRKTKPEKKDLMYTVSDYQIYNPDSEKNKNETTRNKKNISKSDLFRSVNFICSRNNSKKNYLEQYKNFYSDDEQQINQKKNFENDLLERKNIKFFHRYKNYKRILKSEEARHYNNKIFNKKEIEKLMKIRNDLEYDKLKYDYAFKIGTIEAINRNVVPKSTLNREELLKRKKEKIANTIENKVQSALNNYEVGKLVKTTYNIEDYIK